MVVDSVVESFNIRVDSFLFLLRELEYLFVTDAKRLLIGDGRSYTVSRGWLLLEFGSMRTVIGVSDIFNNTRPGMIDHAFPEDG